jgi:hypothetical protein
MYNVNYYLKNLNSSEKECFYKIVSGRSSKASFATGESLSKISAPGMSSTLEVEVEDLCRETGATITTHYTRTDGVMDYKTHGIMVVDGSGVKKDLRCRRIDKKVSDYKNCLSGQVFLQK